ncbi:MAG: DUF1499 domain-containing protein [Pseudomonadales bacterium]|jgi:hypothetical protein|nr:DUF1499 domain-containing protein [Pseudomonadales bacterium]MBP9032250.1 DUF1499 domain-containing protein [Pseudomonadales bacterium]
MNRTAALCRATAALCVLLLFAAPLATKSGLVSWKLGLPLTALAFLGGAVLLLVSLVLLALPAWRAVRAPLAASAVLAALPALAGVAVIAPGIGLPAIHDVSTDIADPPPFVALLALRGPGANPLVRSPEVDAAQRAAWPGLVALDSPLPPAQAFERAAATARELGWQVHAEDAAAGLIEASASTFWFGFVDDVVIRVRAHAGGSRIDLRSVSRVGQGDLGANARRIARFIERFPP